MAKYRETKQCDRMGCTGRGFFEFASRREQAEASKRTYRCLKHTQPDEWMTPENVSRTVTLTATRLPYVDPQREPSGFLPGLFWVADGRNSGSGFTFGPGFRADAKEFPEGTRLTITATVVLPIATIAALDAPAGSEARK